MQRVSWRLLRSFVRATALLTACILSSLAGLAVACALVIPIACSAVQVALKKAPHAVALVGAASAKIFS